MGTGSVLRYSGIEFSGVIGLSSKEAVWSIGRIQNLYHIHASNAYQPLALLHSSFPLLKMKRAMLSHLALKQAIHVPALVSTGLIY